MNKECEGCYCIRVLVDGDLVKYHPDQLSCEHETLNCPCKTCLVKMMCDITINGMICKKWMDFNIKHGTSEYWEDKRKEHEYANKVQSCKTQNEK